MPSTNAKGASLHQSVKGLPEADLLSRISNGFTLPELNSNHVSQYEQWSAEHPTYLANLFERAEPFLYYIVEQIEARGLPMEIALLPAVESAYKAGAVSRSSAVGLWQFIASTGHEYGLEQDWWYDGRRDVIASTDAALDYLTVLHARFDNDWFLALAAYNGGQGNLARSIKTNQDKALNTDYLALDLRLETRRYVPKLIALRNILRDPEKFGVFLPKIPNKPAFTALALTKQVDLVALAKDTNLDENQLTQLNSGFLRWATPPPSSLASKSRPAKLLIPSTDSHVIATISSALSKSSVIEFASHRIEKGDSLGRIAHKYGVSVASLKQSNNLSSNTIRLGNNILVPVNTQALASVSDPTGLARANSMKIATGTKQAFQIKSSLGGNLNGISQSRQWIQHQVLKGETLWSIARRYSVSVSDILSWNKLSLNRPLQMDQILKLFP
jgi:membrane-bound lytic murein transglycosylase D